MHVGGVHHGREQRHRALPLGRIDDQLGVTLEGVDLGLGDVDALEQVLGGLRLPIFPKVGDALGTPGQDERDGNQEGAEALRQHGGWHS